MGKIIIVGGGGHAKAVITIIKKIKKYRLLGYVDVKDQGTILGVPYLGDDQKLPGLLKRNPRCGAVLGVGYVVISPKRRELSDKLRKIGFQLPAIVSPTAVINEEVTIGGGTVVHDNVVVNSGTHIGECAIINNASSIDHDCRIGDFVHIAPGVILSGGVVVGNDSLLGVGCRVLQYKTIGQNCIIGAGAAVIKDCLKPGVYVGIPAKNRRHSVRSPIIFRRGRV